MHIKIESELITPQVMTMVAWLKDALDVPGVLVTEGQDENGMHTITAKREIIRVIISRTYFEAQQYIIDRNYKFDECLITLCDSDGKPNLTTEMLTGAIVEYTGGVAPTNSGLYRVTFTKEDGSPGYANVVYNVGVGWDVSKCSSLWGRPVINWKPLQMSAYTFTVPPEQFIHSHTSVIEVFEWKGVEYRRYSGKIPVWEYVIGDSIEPIYDNAKEEALELEYQKWKVKQDDILA